MSPPDPAPRPDGRAPAPGRTPERASGVTPALEGRGLVKTYRLGTQEVRALQGVDISVRPGEFVSVMGPSGSGKSTLLHLLGLLDAPDAGEVRVGGRPTTGLDDDDLTALRRDRLGFVFQTFQLVPTLNARENVLLPAEVAGRRGEAEPRLTELAELLGIADRLDHRPKELSGGQRQRVALARALINEPDVILADEPTGNLDSQTGAEVLGLLRRGVDERGWTVVMVTHDPKAALFADRIVFLKDGSISGSSSTTATDARAMIEAFVGV